MTSDGTEENIEYCWIVINGEFGKGILPIYAAKGLGGLGDNWKEELISGWIEFQNDLTIYEPPLEVEADTDMQDLLDSYAEAKKEFDAADAMLKAITSDIKSKAKESGAKHIIGNGFKVDMVERKGNVDYKKIPELKTVDLDSYRKKPATFFQIKPIDKEA
ncbi:hypothetical protein THIOSC15_2560001 [uncultured Thiomicrorhabdus sp.]